MSFVFGQKDNTDTIKKTGGFVFGEGKIITPPILDEQLRTPYEIAMGLKETPEERATKNPVQLLAGIGKGALSTLATPAKSLSKASETIGAINVAQQYTENIPTLQRQADQLTLKYIGMASNDPQKSNVRELIKGINNQINTLSGILSDTEKEVGTQTQERFSVLKPETPTQKLGFTTEQLAEFFIPTSAVNKLNKAVSTGVNLSKIGIAAEDGNKLAKFVSWGLKAGARSAGEALSFGGITLAQTGDVEEAKKQAEWGAAISGGISLAGVVGAGFKEAARRIYSSSAKFSTAGKYGAEKAAQNVETGLNEGIRLTQGGLKKTESVINNLEAQVGRAIEKATDKQGMVEVAKLKPFVDDAKEHFSNIADVIESNKAFQTLDDMFTSFSEKYGDKVPVKVAQEIKVNTYKWLKGEYGKLGTASIEGSKAIVRGLKEGIVDLAPEVGNINARLKSLYQFDVGLEKSVGRMKNLNLLGLDTKALLGIAAGSKSLPLVIGTLALKVASLPFNKSLFAINLFRLGNLLEFLSPAEATIVAANPTVKSLLERIKGAPVGALSPSETKVAQKIADFIDNPKIGLAIEDVSKQGFKDSGNLTTKLLTQLEGKTTVSKQFIEDLTNQGALRQPERDLIRKTLSEVKGNEINVSDFANKVKTELLPLEIKSAGGKWEMVNLPDELRGKVSNYEARVYQSPIKTSAGEVHYNTGGSPDFNSEGYPNYFAHTRIEDLPPQEQGSGLKGVFDRIDEIQKNSPFKDIGGTNKSYKNRIKNTAAFLGKSAKNETQSTRRVIEIQSDLFQKGRLETEKIGAGRGRLSGLHDANDIIQERLTPSQFNEYQKNLTSAQKSTFLDKIEPGLSDKIKKQVNDLAEKQIADKSAELSKLEPYRNTWHERIIREEIKQAAKDGKTKLQFPTGETAMKIEGLGERNQWGNPKTFKPLEINELKVGKEVTQNEGSYWIITDVLGDGKFKAVPKSDYESFTSGAKKLGKNIDEMANYQSAKETFDISGKVDTSNPIYKFYEKDVQKFLNKFGGKKVKDAQGVEWIEVPITKEMGTQPVQAFGKAQLGTVIAGGATAVGAALLPFLKKAIPANEFTIDASAKARAAELPKRKASFSAYNPVEGQTDDTPTIMASGKEIYDGAIASGDRSIPFGTKVYLPELDKVFTVEDRMNKRYDGQEYFDILMPSLEDARKFGRQNLDYVILENF